MSRVLRAYGIAVVLTAIGSAVVVWLNATLHRSFFSTLTIAVILSAWYGGIGPGLLASLLSVMSINYFLQEPRFQLSIGSLSDAIQLVIFACAAILLSMLTHSRARAREEAELATKQAAREEALANLARLGAAERDPQKAISFICGQGCRLLDADYGAVITVEPTRRVWHGGFGVRNPRGMATRGRGTGLSQQALDAGHALAFEHLQQQPDVSQFHAEEGAHVVVVAPCVGRDDFRAVLQFGWRSDVAITPEQLRLAEAVAAYAAVIFENASQHATLGERAETVRLANEQLLRVDEMKNNLISNVSHELRTPLSSIRAFSELLLDEGVDTETRREFTQIINDESERLTRLVTNLLDLSRIQAHGVAWHFQSLDARRELETAVAALRPAADKKQLALKLELAPEVGKIVADPDGLQQALVNLIANAVKFTDRGQVTVSASRENGRVRVAIRDTGPGMAKDDQSRVFDRFYQAGDVLTSKPAGTGLGLAITKEILVQHGTDIQLESAPGEGSTFSFLLPASTESRLSEAR